MRDYRLVVVVVMAFVLSRNVHADEKRALLKVTLSSEKMGMVRVVFHNGTGSDVRLDKHLIVHTNLVLEVRDAAGKEIYGVPPSVPPAKPEFVIIPAGKEYSQSYKLDVYMPPLAPGKYRIRLRLDEWKSNELEHVLEKKAD